MYLTFSFHSLPVASMSHPSSLLTLPVTSMRHPVFLCMLHLGRPCVTPFLCVFVDWFLLSFMSEIIDSWALEGTFFAHFEVFGRSRATIISHWISDAILGDFYGGCPHERVAPFWSTFGILFGTWASHVAFFIVFLRSVFEARFFIDFGWPQGSKIDAFGGWPTWLKCGK